MSQSIYVFADWEEIEEPELVGVLNVAQVRNSEVFRFAYENTWLQSEYRQQIDADLQLYVGDQFSKNDQNFRIFLDSCPDRWGRLLMQRRESVYARREKRVAKSLSEADYLLGVHDDYRMGALRFKASLDGEFLNNDHDLAAPPLSILSELEYAAAQIENDPDLDSDEYLKWLQMLMAPGSSLGGARPKASVVGDDGSLWIAKFPNRMDSVDIAAWEFVVYKLALKAGIKMSECTLKIFNGKHHTFLTKRFDRSATSRKHFSSAMAQLGYYDGDEGASYLELAEFLIKNGATTKNDLSQLWRRIVFNIAVSNTDDHLRNHGFLFTKKGWVLSPAYDMNPAIHSTGLHLNIDQHDNSLSFDLAFKVTPYFQLSQLDADKIYQEVIKSVKSWEFEADKLGISRNEQKLMAKAFRF